MLSKANVFGLIFFNCWFSGDPACEELSKNFLKTLHKLRRKLILVSLVERVSPRIASVVSDESSKPIGRITCGLGHGLYR